MKKEVYNYSIFILMFLLIFASIDYSSIKITKADMYVPITLNSSGVFVEAENLSLVLETANVEYYVNYTIEDIHILRYDFFGEFVISNPNETIDGLVVLPLTEPFEDSTLSNFDLQVNHSSLDSYTVVDLWYDYSTYMEIIEKSFNDTIWHVRHFLPTFIFFNQTFEKDSHTHLSYSYSNYQKRGPYGSCKTNDNRLSEMQINYFIGTARNWNHNITESILMSVIGSQPDSYSNNCQVTQLENDVEYLWEWVDEPVIEDIIRIVYEFEELNCVSNEIWFPLIACVFMTIVIRKKKK